MKNIVLKFVALVVFVIMPFVFLSKMPVEKGFSCSKSVDLCKSQYVNIFDSVKNIETINFSEIKNVEEVEGKMLFGLYKTNDVLVNSKNKSLKLDYNFTQEELSQLIKDYNKFVATASDDEFEFVAQKDSYNINVMIFACIVSVLFGLMVVFGIIKDKPRHK